MRLVLIVCVIVVQLAIIAYLVTRLTAPAYSVTTVDRASIYTPPESRYEFFYDTRSNTHSINGSAPIPEDLNASGFRDRTDYPLSKPPRTIRIVALGDSDTYGVGVRTEETWPERLEARLAEQPLCPGVRYEVINLGMHGYDVRFAEERFRLRGAAYDPDIVLWYVHRGDFHELKDEEDRRLAALFAATGKTTVEDIIAARKGIENDFGLDRIITMNAESIGIITAHTPARVVIFASKAGLTDGVTRAIEAQTAAHPSVRFIVPLPGIPQDMQFPNDGHANPKGNEYVANRLHQHFTANPDVLPPCPAA